MDYHSIAAGIALVCSLSANVIYIRDTLKRKTKPHLFTWLVWAIVMGIAATVSFAEGATASAIVIGHGSFWCFVISLLALRYGEKAITRSDWGMFLSALAIIPLWAVTKEPLVAALLATAIDTFGYGPTFRKAWHKPWEENLKAFSVHVLLASLSVLAVSPYLLVTGLYPTAILIMNAALVLMLIIRRRALSPAEGGA
ncbi:MAG TPA: hypothetical protein DCY07_04365 [Rhodospirillaceae bacterium]|nr:hypothetical protein [Rhodospirillaceae bacterium]